MVNELTTQVPDAGRAVTEELYGLFKDDPLLFGKRYTPSYFTLGTPDFHEIILEQSLTNRFLAIQTPRGSAKSTILSFLRVLHGICFKRFHFIVIVQNTQKKSEGSLDGIKKEFIDNQRIAESFGVKMTKSAAHDTVFRHPDGFETRVLCFGQEQIGSIRGERFGAYRPDLIIIDDLEDDELVKNPDRRRDMKFLYDDALIPAGDYEKLCVFAIGTLLHHDSLIARLVAPDEYKEYKKLFFMALYRDKDTGKEASLWPEKWTVDDLKKMRDEKPSTFAKEMQGNPTSGYMRRFDRTDFRYWKREENNYVCYDEENKVVSRGTFRECKGAIACDLAWEEKRQSDDSVIMPAYLTPDNMLLIDEYICEKGMRPNQLEEIIFSMEKRMKELTGDVIPVGFEKAKLEKVVSWFLRRAMKQRNHYLILRTIPWATDKIERIITRLQPRYKMHVIFHRRGMGKLEQQLVQFPEGVHDDLPDAEQMLSYMLNIPKGKKKQVVEDDAFEKLRKWATESRMPKRSVYAYGFKQKRSPVPASTCPIE